MKLHELEACTYRSQLRIMSENGGRIVPLEEISEDYHRRISDRQVRIIYSGYNRKTDKAYIRIMLDDDGPQSMKADWHPFNVNDPTTWPPNEDESYLITKTCYGKPEVLTDWFDKSPRSTGGNHWSCAADKDVIAWAEKPRAYRQLEGGAE